MANVSKNDQAILRNLTKAGVVQPAAPKPKSKEESQAQAIAARRKEMAK